MKVGEYKSIIDCCLEGRNYPGDKTILMLDRLPERPPSIILELAHASKELLKYFTGTLTNKVLTFTIAFVSIILSIKEFGSDLLTSLLLGIGIPFLLPTFVIQRTLCWAWIAKFVIKDNKKCKIPYDYTIPPKFKLVSNLLSFFTVLIPYIFLFSIWIAIKYFSR